MIDEKDEETPDHIEEETHQEKVIIPEEVAPEKKVLDSDTPHTPKRTAFPHIQVRT